jgi:hypothetical protein
LKDYINSISEMSDNFQEDLMSFIRKTLPESKELILKNLTDNAKNILQSKDVILMNDL